jgi:RimJ/RimL family protein N-acetyltransferase
MVEHRTSHILPISVTVPDNIRSRRVMEKCGLTYQGELSWREYAVVWYAIGRTTWTEIAAELTG